MEHTIIILTIFLPFLYSVKTEDTAHRFNCAKNDTCLCSATMVRACKSSDGHLEISNLPRQIKKIAPKFLVTDMNTETLVYLESLSLRDNLGLQKWGVIFEQYKDSLKVLALENNPHLEIRPLGNLLLRGDKLEKLEIGGRGVEMSDTFKKILENSSIKFDSGAENVFEGQELDNLRKEVKTFKKGVVENWANEKAEGVAKILSGVQDTFSSAGNKTKNFFKSIPETMSSIKDRTKEAIGLGNPSSSGGEEGAKRVEDKSMAEVASPCCFLVCFFCTIWQLLII